MDFALSTKVGDAPTEVLGIIFPSSSMAIASTIAKSISP